MRLRTPQKCLRRNHGMPSRPWLRMAFREARRWGVRVTRAQAGYILWNETAFPYEGEARVRADLRRAFALRSRP